jgi:very-short-patch-repair endonuclease
MRRPAQKVLRFDDSEAVYDFEKVVRAKKNKRFEDELLWQIRIHRLPEPEREFYFAEPRKFRSDFAWPAYRVLLEIQGGIWQRGGGGHSHPMHIVKDIERQQHAALHGWFVVPVTTDQCRIKDGGAVAVLESVLKGRGWTP